jgi:hypothetical protein
MQCLKALYCSDNIISLVKSMLDVIRYRTNEFQLYEPTIQRHRSLTNFIYKSSIIIIGLSCILLVLSIIDIIFFHNIVQNTLLSILLMLIIVFLIIIFTYLSYNLFLILHINMIVGQRIVTNPMGKVEVFSKKRFLQGKMDEFNEEEIRFTQAIGIRIVSTYLPDTVLTSFLDYNFVRYLMKIPRDGNYFRHYSIEILYDENIPGIEIFVTKNPIIIVECIKIYQKLMTNLKIIQYMDIILDNLELRKTNDMYNDTNEDELELFSELFETTLLNEEFRTYFRELY